MNNIFGSIFASGLTVGTFLLAIISSIILGFIVALTFMYKNTHTKSFISALVLIPAIETVVIMLVNDNIGVGLSVAGSFALIRFRSVKGNAKELLAVFLAMTIGIVCGSGYIVLAGIFTLLICVVIFVLALTDFGKQSDNDRYLKITIPESLEYEEAFDDILKRYTKSYELDGIKTLALGSIFRLDYKIVMKNSKQLKEMINEIRVRNGNLEIMCGKNATNRDEL